MPLNCPECGQVVSVRYHQADSYETHGLESGPFEHFYDEWYECPLCGARFSERDLAPEVL